MTSRMGRWKSLMEKAEEEEGGDDPEDGGVHPAAPREGHIASLRKKIFFKWILSECYRKE
jgi:hypothetical protein